MGTVDMLRLRAHGRAGWSGTVTILGVAGGVATCAAAVLLLTVAAESPTASSYVRGDLLVQAPVNSELDRDQERVVREAPGVWSSEPVIDQTVRFGPIDRPGGRTGRLIGAPEGDRDTIAPWGDAECRADRQNGRAGGTVVDGAVWVGPGLASVVGSDGRLPVRAAGVTRFADVAGVIHCTSASTLSSGNFALASLDDARRLAGAPDGVDALVVRVTRESTTDDVAADLEQRLGGRAAVETPGRHSGVGLLDAPLRRAVAVLVAAAIGLAAALASLAAAFGARSRRSRLDTLAALGATPAELRRLLIWEAIGQGSVGSVLGIGAGSIAAWWLARRLPAVNGVHPSIELSMSLSAAVTAVVLGIIISTVAVVAVGRQPSRETRSNGPPRRGASRIGWRSFARRVRAPVGGFGRPGRIAALVPRLTGTRMVAVIIGIATIVVTAVSLGGFSQRALAAHERDWARVEGVDLWVQAAPLGELPGPTIVARDQLGAVQRAVGNGSVTLGVMGELRLSGATVDVSAAGDGSAWPLWADASARSRASMREGNGIVLTPAAAVRLGAKAGDRVVVPTVSGPVTVVVAEVVDGGLPGVEQAGMAEAVYQEWFGPTGPSWLEIRLDPRASSTTRRALLADLQSVVDQPVSVHRGSYQLLSSRDELTLAAGVVDAIAWVVIAACALMVLLVVSSSGAERGVDRAVLRDLGLDRGAARVAATLETGLAAIAGLALGLPLGLVVRGRLVELVVGTPLGWSSSITGAAAWGLAVGGAVAVGGVAMMAVAGGRIGSKRQLAE